MGLCVTYSEAFCKINYFMPEMTINALQSLTWLPFAFTARSQDGLHDSTAQAQVNECLTSYDCDMPDHGNVKHIICQ